MKRLDILEDEDRLEASYALDYLREGIGRIRQFKQGDGTMGALDADWLLCRLYDAEKVLSAIAGTGENSQ